MLFVVAAPLAAAFLVGLIVGPLGDAKGTGRKRDPIEGHFPIEMPRYPDAVEEPLGRDVRFGQAPVWMSVFSTHDEPARVADFYRAAWERLGLHVEDGVTRAGGVVSAYDPAAKRMRQVMLQRRGATTWVFPSVTDTPSALLQPDDAGDLPVFPNATARFGFVSRDGGARWRVATYEDAGTLDENLAFLRSTLGAAKWTETNNARDDRGASRGSASPLVAAGPDHRLLLMSRAGAEMTIDVERLEPRRTRVRITEMGE